MKLFNFKREPVIPCISQEGEYLHKIQISGFSFNAISNVFSAPLMKYTVTSFPVYNLLNCLSAHVSYTRPLILFTGGRGVGNPPNISGQMSIISETLFVFRKFFRKLLKYVFLPCHRHGLPIRQELTNIFIFKRLQSKFKKYF